MAKHTSLPFMVAEEQDGAREDWYVLECQLCWYRTFGGSFYVAEMEAADHLDEVHPVRRRKAEEIRKARAAAYAATARDNPITNYLN